MIYRLPAPPDEPPVNHSLECLAPRFRVRVASMLSSLSMLGLDPIIAESCRTDARQRWLFGFGREWDDGRGVVTQAPTGEHSWHRYGLAVDVISLKHGWDAPESFWRELGTSAETHGLVWGGSWPRFQDRPHVQWGAPMRQAPSSRASELLEQGGFRAVWREVRAL